MNTISITSQTFQLRVETYFKDIFEYHVNRVCGLHDLVSYKCVDLKKRKLTWTGYKHLFEVTLIGELSKITATIEHLKRLERGK